MVPLSLLLLTYTQGYRVEHLTGLGGQQEGVKSARYECCRRSWGMVGGGGDLGTLEGTGTIERGLHYTPSAQ